MAAAEKVTLSATLESNYHVLNGPTLLHLHPPLFPPCQSLLPSPFWAKITLGDACVALRWTSGEDVSPRLLYNADVFDSETGARSITVFLWVYKARVKYSRYCFDWVFDLLPFVVKAHKNVQCYTSKKHILDGLHPKLQTMHYIPNMCNMKLEGINRYQPCHDILSCSLGQKPNTNVLFSPILKCLFLHAGLYNKCWIYIDVVSLERWDSSGFNELNYIHVWWC